MSKSVLRTLLAFTLLSGQWVLAVDENRIWLPKKYSSVKPKLLAAAKEAEETKRCKQVVAGEMIVRKNTDEHYYFVITCRDESYKTYNLSYHYPVTGQTPALVAEQFPKNAKKKEKVEITATGVNKDQAVTLCRNELISSTDTQDGVTVLEDLLADPVADGEGFLFAIPFTALSELGNETRYRADCWVGKEGKARIEVILEPEGALVICRDSLRAESILLGRSRVIDEEIKELLVDKGGFRFQIPFDAKTSGSNAIRYRADCQIDADGSNEIEMTLQPLGAFTLCKDGLRIETFLMKSVEIAEQPLSESVQGDHFLFQLSFTANDPDGNKRNFKAHCQVDEEGDVEVTTEIDKDAILSVCVGDLKVKTKTMLDVTILEQQIPDLKEEGEGYVGIIPFDAKSPSGRTLRYQAECRVNGSGHSTIKLKARRD
ncbi:MAG: hypothetical protein V3T17_14200 [Pseudomonadales bacterium]